VGEGLQGVCHAHRPQGWAPTKKRSLALGSRLQGAGSLAVSCQLLFIFAAMHNFPGLSREIAFFPG
jgi:hypothetical protein